MPTKEKNNEDDEFQKADDATDDIIMGKKDNINEEKLTKPKTSPTKLLDTPLRMAKFCTATAGMGSHQLTTPPNLKIIFAVISSIGIEYAETGRQTPCSQPRGFRL